MTTVFMSYSGANAGFQNHVNALKGMNICQYPSLLTDDKNIDIIRVNQYISNRIVTYSITKSPGDVLSCQLQKFSAGNVNFFLSIDYTQVKSSIFAATIYLDGIQFSSSLYPDRYLPVWLGVRTVLLDSDQQQDQFLVQASIGELLDEMVANFKLSNPGK
ncbi:hypothetical protein FNU79_03310 [Deinococcus detaillensis]|uniref:Uncharacterized protein n=1 Tax=Deinococcus detaillensis TaxID=2592048 RepID=A0A553V4W5_9DEIO|nr:hypothetical protein [Deinococcus detaillensis]TSA87523.1 hypothetical protein FNU79_03310 [Deinococcus detaillensis]